MEGVRLINGRERKQPVRAAKKANLMKAKAETGRSVDLSNDENQVDEVKANERQ